ncbi:Hypothetical protein A7982_07607 [Minicystis rosea]|nr:Hypothetical protein A7982_07607 [Minicystis rosea]
MPAEDEMELGRGRDLLQRVGAGCFANLGLKLFALVVAVILHVFLVLRAPERPPAPQPPACTP